jgi:integrase
LSIKKEHINLSTEARYCKVEKTDVLIPPGAVLVAKGKDGNPRALPLNRVARNVFKLLVEDATTGEWLFTNRNGEPIKAIKKGFTAACVRAEIEDLRPYDLRHTFATRLVERGVHHFVISALLGHTTPLTGFGFASRITPGYAHATWDAMVAAVESLEHQPALKPNMFVVQAKEGQPQAGEARKAS